MASSAAGTDSTLQLSCTSCQRSPPEVSLKHCAKCSTTPYCSRDCQRADWKSHKKTCRKQGSASATASAGMDSSTSSPSGGTQLSPPRGLDAPIAKPFTRLDNGIWLHDRPEKDVYRLLIDAYRLRMEDTYVHDQDADADSIYGGATHGLSGFRRFLDMAAEQADLLPPWWDADKRKACERMGMDHRRENFHNLACAIKKSDVIEHYGDSRFPMQLRMFAETVYKRAPGGMDGTVMRKMMAAMEGGDGPGAMSMLDVSQGLASAQSASRGLE